MMTRAAGVFFLAFALSCGRAETEAELAARAAALHARIFTIDTHIDTPTSSLLRAGWDIGASHDVASDFSQCDFPRMQQGGLDAAFFVIYTEQRSRTPDGRAAARDTALKTALRVHRAIARNSALAELATTAEDGPRIAATGKRAIYLSIENGYPIGEDLTLLKTFRELGVRIFGLVHNGNNDLADSIRDAKGAEWRGLSPLGRAAIAECNRLGLVVDGSHASDETLHQMIEASATPVILSHSSCRAIADNRRNVPDELIRALAAKGGVIQMNTVFVVRLPDNPARNAAVHKVELKYAGRELTEAQEGEAWLEVRQVEAQFPSPRATLDDFLRHLFHALEIAGADHVGIGSDFDGGGGVEGLDQVSDYPKVTLALLQHGVSEADVEKIWGGNTLRLLRIAEQYAQERAIAKSSGSGR